MDFKSYILESHWDDVESVSLHRRLTKHYIFNPNEEETINRYTNYSSNINNTLLDYHDKKYNPKQLEKVVHLDKILSSYDTPEDIIGYTGINGKHQSYLKHLSRKCTGDSFLALHPAYLSTSLNRDMAETFADRTEHDASNFYVHLLKIKIPKGSSGVYADHISSREGEKEFILPRGLNIHIQKNSELIKIPTESGTKHLHIWNANL